MKRALCLLSHMSDNDSAVERHCTGEISVNENAELSEWDGEAVKIRPPERHLYASCVIADEDSNGAPTQRGGSSRHPWATHPGPYGSNSSGHTSNTGNDTNNANDANTGTTIDSDELSVMIDLDDCEYDVIVTGGGETFELRQTAYGPTLRSTDE